MRFGARRFRRSLLIAAFVIGAGAETALAQELQVDPKALDASGAASVTTKRKAKKPSAAASQAADKAGQQSGHGPDRQFGELEGWSPGKAPPKPREKETQSGPSKGAIPVGVSPSGNMSVGLPF